METFNEEFQGYIFPVCLGFTIFDIVGFIGNILVMYVYYFHYPRKHFRCLVLALSIVDFTACCSTVPMEIVSTWYWFASPSLALCKAKNFFVQFTGLSAMYMLFVTAVFKFRQICTPLSKQLSQRTFVILCLIGIFNSLCFAIPAAVLWDLNKHEITRTNVTENVTVCEVDAQYRGTIYPEMYRHFISVYDIFLLATIVLYFFVAKTTIQYVRKSKRGPDAMQKKKLSKSGDSNTSGSDSNTTSETIFIDDGNERKCLPDKTVKATPSNSTVGQRKIQIRKVVIMTIIAGTFSITFLMALTFGYVFAIRGYQDYKSLGEIVLLFSLYRFYFMNYAMNPVVYFSLDKQFRKGLRQLFSSRDDEYDD